MATPWRQQPLPEQEQAYPGQTGEMDPRPRDEMRDYEGRGLLRRGWLNEPPSGLVMRGPTAVTRSDRRRSEGRLAEVRDRQKAADPSCVRLGG